MVLLMTNDEIPPTADAAHANGQLHAPPQCRWLHAVAAQIVGEGAAGPRMQVGGVAQRVLAYGLAHIPRSSVAMASRMETSHTHSMWLRIRHPLLALSHVTDYHTAPDLAEFPGCRRYLTLVPVWNDAVAVR